MLKGMSSLLKSVESLENMRVRMHNKAKGYEPKCKVCNHENKDEIERFHELGYSNRDVMRELGLTKSDFTEQALGRHLNHHYPLSKRYYTKQRLLNEKALQDAFNDNSQLKDFIFDNDDETSFDFLNKRGFCCTGNCLCYLIKPATYDWGEDVLNGLRTEFYNIKYDYSHRKENEIIEAMERLNKCYSCQLYEIQSEHNLLFEILIKEVFKIDIDYEKDLKNIMFYADYDKDCIINELNKFKKE